MNPLTPRQQALVNQNIALVHLQAKRQRQRMPGNLRKREGEDLLQEGMLGLMQAAAHYKPRQCGPFAPYALAYIHGAICRYLLRQMGGLMVPPVIALDMVRRRRAARTRTDLGSPQTVAEVGSSATRPTEPGEERPISLPRFHDLESAGANLAKMACRKARESAAYQAEDMAASGKAGWTAEQLHTRYEQALQWAVQQVKATPQAKVDHMALVHAVVQERLMVREGQYRTARRAMAQRFGCSPTRVWNLETRIFRLIQRRLAMEAGLSHKAATLVCRTAKTAAATRDDSSESLTAALLRNRLLQTTGPGR
jgi:RNA polymerase sigma factor (sigma-70 family)